MAGFGIDTSIAFQSTPPVKAATTSHWYLLAAILFQSTPPVKAATGYTDEAKKPLVISIHAAREGGD